MSHEPNPAWQPLASRDKLVARAQLYQQIRQFFIDRNVLEVETPIASQHRVSDPFLDSFVLHTADARFLQTSPEYAMKRLLAAGSGCIFQIAKCFRQDECGAKHNPEFSMLEWYRVGFDHQALMQEIDLLLQLVLNTPPAELVSYQQLFQKTCAICPLDISTTQLQNYLQQQHIKLPESFLESKTDMLQALFALRIEPLLGFSAPVMVYDFPKEQAALSRISKSDPRVAHRFEVYVRGIELANGFYELTCADEQRSRFTKDNLQREKLGKEQVTLDENFLAALQHGLPECSGVALGLDRLLMLAQQVEHMDEVLSFNWRNA